MARLKAVPYKDPEVFIPALNKRLAGLASLTFTSRGGLSALFLQGGAYRI